MRVAKRDALNESPGGRAKGADTGPRGATTLLDLWVSTKNVVQPDAKNDRNVAQLQIAKRTTRVLGRGQPNPAER